MINNTYDELNTYMKDQLINLITKYKDIGAKSNPTLYKEALFAESEPNSYSQSYCPNKVQTNYNASSCALFVRAQLKRLGIIPYNKHYSYLEDGGAIAQLIKILSPYKIQLPTTISDPELLNPGYIVIINPAAGHSSWHVFTTLSNNTVIEGGQDGPLSFSGGTAILQNTRNWTFKNNILYSEKNNQYRSVHSIYDLDL